jgi:hypothetical protein
MFLLNVFSVTSPARNPTIAYLICRVTEERRNVQRHANSVDGNPDNTEGVVGPVEILSGSYGDCRSRNCQLFSKDRNCFV